MFVTRAQIIVIAVVLAILGVLTTIAVTGKPAATPAPSQSAAELKACMRQVWADHAWYTREYYVAAIHSTANAGPAVQRLMSNQDEIGAVFGKYYGAEAGARTAALLKEHIVIAGEIVTAAKAGDAEKLAEANARWHKNFEDVAAFLATANPQHFPYAPTLHLLHEHLRLLTVAVTSFLTGNYGQSIVDNDAYVHEILMMADHFSNGIIAQFPEKFA